MDLPCLLDAFSRAEFTYFSYRCLGLMLIPTKLAIMNGL